MIAAVAVSALHAGNSGNAEALASVEQEFDGSQRVITAALREIAAGVAVSRERHRRPTAIDGKR